MTPFHLSPDYGEQWLICNVDKEPDESSVVALEQYLNCARHAVDATRAFKRAKHFRLWFKERFGPGKETEFCRILPDMNWRWSFSARLKRERTRRVVRLVEDTPPTTPTFRDRILVLADSVQFDDFAHNCMVHEAFYSNGYVLRTAVRLMYDQDLCWVRRCYSLRQSTHSIILEMVTARRDTDTMCDLILQSGAVSAFVGDKIFLCFDADKIIRALRERNLQISWAVYKSNHEKRELERRGDPTIPPLAASMYEYMMEKSAIDNGSWSLHEEVRNAIECLLVMKRDGRISEAKTDAKIDEVLAAVSDRSEMYKYFHDRSMRVVNNRFVEAVVVGAARLRDRDGAGGRK